MRRGCISLLLIGLTLIGCKKQTDTQVVDTPSTVIKEVSNTDKEESVDQVLEGALSYQLSFTDLVIDGFVKYISKDPLLANELIEEYSAKLKDSERSHLKVVLSNNPDFNVTYGSLPFLKNDLYLAGYEVVYKGQGLGYTLENKWNDLLEEGYGFVESRIVPNSSLNFKYKKELLEAQALQVNINEEKFTRETTGESMDVAGYKTEKVIYTHKPSTPDGERVLPISVVVYVSRAFNPVINKVMPFYVNEEFGILKMEVVMNNKSDLKLVYEATRAVKRKTLETETSILTAKTLFEVKDTRDILALDMQLSKVIVAPRM